MSHAVEHGHELTIAGLSENVTVPTALGETHEPVDGAAVE